MKSTFARGTRPFHEPGDEVPGSRAATRRDHRVERLEPLLGLLRVDVGELVNEPVDEQLGLFSGVTRAIARGPG